MSKTQQRADLAIDHFVERVNQAPRESLPAEEVPEFLREGLPGPGGWEVSWFIRPAAAPCKWVDDFEARLPGRLPRAYKSLVARYLTPAFAGRAGEVVREHRDRAPRGP